MEKYSQDKETLRSNLINEEHDLMRKMSQFMTSGEKTAEVTSTETRLQHVRMKIYEIDHEKDA